MLSLTTVFQAASEKSIVHVEVCTKELSSEPELLERKVAQWLTDNYLKLRLNQTIATFVGLQTSEELEVIQITDIIPATKEEPFVSLLDADINVQAYHLHNHDFFKHRSSLGIDSPEEELIPQCKITQLPNQELHHIWDLLVFDEPIQRKLLHFVTRMLTFASRQISSTNLPWNRLVLLYGPSGTGKTSLCRALAQKLSIRLGTQYPHSKLIEIDSHSLFSKYFSESGKLVGKMFELVESILDAEEDTFICVLIDEVESLTSARDDSLGGNDPRDALRAVNALLTALDRLRFRPNVVVLCTSNLIKAMDSAFLDRVDIKQYIPEPGARARYEIYRTSYIELARCGIIAPLRNQEDAHLINETAIGIQSNTNVSENYWDKLNDSILPPYDLMVLHCWTRLNCPARALWDVAERSNDLSGRALRRLPAMALAIYTNHDPCTIEEAVECLSRSVDK
ncbi:hypothetical protein MMC06_001943 [Schaereria dolodes]|nr:hypothetical protein [Schaereria dolodes]